MAEWTDELKKQIVEEYVSRKPTPENSIEILKELAEEFDKTPNGIRVILSRANVYVKKIATTTSSSTTNNSSETKPKRMLKSEVLGNLSALIEANGLEANPEIIDKLTGKAGQYFIDIIEKIVDKDEDES